MLRMMMVLVMVSLAFPAFVLAEKPTRQQRREHADRNDDGTVDRKEKKMEREFEQQQRSKVNTPREEKADANEDGRIDRKEARDLKGGTEERVDWNNDGVISPKERGMSWQHSRAKVNKPAEARYDADGSGWLEPAEVKRMLADKQTLVKTKGKARVDSPIEAQYDDNKDGMIDPEEAKDLQNDLAQ